MVYFQGGPVLIHTTQGDLLRCLEPPSNYTNPRILLMSRDCFVVVCFDKGDLCLFSASGRLLKQQKTDMQIGVRNLKKNFFLNYLIFLLTFVLCFFRIIYF